MSGKASKREAAKRLAITNTINEFEVVSQKGNWVEVIVKVYNLHRGSEMSLREVMDPKTRSLSVKQTAIELMVLAECLEEIAYHKENEEDEDISEPEGDDQGSGEGSVRDGDEVSD